MAQLVERSLPTPEVRGSNPVIRKLFYRTFVYCQLSRKDKNKEKEAGNGTFFCIKDKVEGASNQSYKVVGAS